jgi:hypothetical protein
MEVCRVGDKKPSPSRPGSYRRRFLAFGGGDMYISPLYGCDSNYSERWKHHLPASKIAPKVRLPFLIFLITSLCAQPVTTPITILPPMLKRRRWCPSPRLHHDGQPQWPTCRIIKSILIYTAIFSLLLRSLPQFTLSLTTVFLLTATYIPLRIMCPSKPLPLLVSLLLFGATQHVLLNPITLTGAILTLFNYQPAIQQYLDPISIALNICTEDPILII